MIRLVVGLGNPGPDYRETRHNAGFWFVDRWAETLGVSFRKPWFRPFLCAEVIGEDHLVLVKPLTYMNRSGEILPELFRRFRASTEDLLVVFDQMDLPPGRVRLKPHGSAAGHNGLKSCDAALGGGEYHRLAVGIGRPASGISVLDHVLGVPSDAEQAAIDDALARCVASAKNLGTGAWEPFLNAINQRSPA